VQRTWPLTITTLSLWGTDKKQLAHEMRFPRGVAEGGCMQSHSRQSFGEEEPNEFPRFLSRTDEDTAAFKPPPLPRDRLIVRVCRWTGGALHRHVTLSAALAVVVPAATAFVAHYGSTTTPAPQHQSAFAAHEEVVDAFAIVERFESRLGYARNLASLEQAPDAATQADPLQALLSETSDPAEFHLPESVTASAGGPVDEKAWTWAATDPALIVMPMGEAPATDESPAIIVSQVTGDSTEPVVPETKLVVHTRPVRTRAIETVASADAPRKKHSKRAKAPLNAKPPVDPDQDVNNDNSESLAENGAGEKKPGVLTKLFSWLKGSKNAQPGDDETSDSTKAGLLRQH
jgi:hypothetical protein